jgi:protein SSD1
VDCDIPALRLLYQTDDENVPNTENVFETRLAYEISEEILIRTNSFIAEKIVAALPTQAMLRRQSPPMPRRLATFGNRINRLDYNIDISSSAGLMSGLFKLEDADVRKVYLNVAPLIRLFTNMRLGSRNPACEVASSGEVLPCRQASRRAP